MIDHDAFLVMQKMFADKSVSELHIYFPDPWPRKREQKRRIIRAEALAEMRRILIGTGIAEFFRTETRIPAPAEPPRTNYEAKYRAQGREIYEVHFWKS